MDVTSLKFMNEKGLPNFPRKAMEFAGGFRLGNSNKFYSTNYKKKLKQLRETYGADVLRNDGFVSLRLTLFTSKFSEYYFNTEALRLHSMIERSIYIAFNVEPLGHEIYFDSSKKSINSTFLFLNHNKKTDQKGLSGQPSKADMQSLATSIKGKIGQFSGISLDPNVRLKKCEKGLVGSPSSSLSLDDFDDEMSKRVFELVNLFGDPAFVAAAGRALKGLDAGRARKLLDSLNGLIEINGDESINKLDMPKKFKKTIHIDGLVRENPSLTEKAEDLFTI